MDSGRHLVDRPAAGGVVCAWAGVADAAVALSQNGMGRRGGGGRGVCGYVGTVRKKIGNRLAMGIDPADKTQLICTGPYAYVRHPIYALSSLLMLMTMVIWPSPVMLAVGVVHLLLLQWEAMQRGTVSAPGARPGIPGISPPHRTLCAAITAPVSTAMIVFV